MGGCFSSEPTYRERLARGRPTQFWQHGGSVDLPRTPCPGCQHHDGGERMDIAPPVNGGGRTRRDGWDMVGIFRHGYELPQFDPRGNNNNHNGRRRQAGNHFDKYRYPRPPPQAYDQGEFPPQRRGAPPPWPDPYGLDEGMY